LDNAYSDVLVINVERRSKDISKVALVDCKNFTKPLSLNPQHLERFSPLNELINCDVAKAPNV
jgi:hypothetical protein